MIQNTKYRLTIGWLYPELMSTYGDRGNIIVLQKRCEWHELDVEVKRLDIGYSVKDLQSCDLLFMGGAQDRQQTIVSEDLKKKVKELSEMIENGTPGLYICGAYQFLGKYYKEADGMIINGLGMFDVYTENPGMNTPRLIGNILCEVGKEFSESYGMKSGNELVIKPTLVGFENHGGRTYLGKNIQPFAKVIKGFGNNGENGTEGAVYKNSFGSYMHGPILPKNPHLADHLIKLALEKKYKKKIHLDRLLDSLDWHAHNVMVNRIMK